MLTESGDRFHMHRSLCSLEVMSLLLDLNVWSWVSETPGLVYLSGDLGYDDHVSLSAP